MNQELKNKIINNLYVQAHKYFSSNIKLDETLLNELFNEKEEIYGLSKQYTTILRYLIGVYSNGETLSHETISKIMNKEITRQNISRAKYTIIKKIYKLDTIIKTKRIKKIPNYKIKLINEDIEILELEEKTLSFLRKQGCKTINDLLEMDKISLRLDCKSEDINYNEIIKRLELFELKFYSDIKSIDQSIEEIDIPILTRKFLKRNNIYTYSQLLEEAPNLINDNNIPEKIRNDIKMFYEENIPYVKQEQELLQEKKQKNEPTILLDLIKQKINLEKEIYKVQEEQEILQVIIEEYSKIIHEHKEEIDKDIYISLKETLQIQGQLSENIKTIQKQIDIIITKINTISNSEINQKRHF